MATKQLTFTLNTPSAQKTGEYIDLFIRGCQGDPALMTAQQKETFIKDYLFNVVKNTVKNQALADAQATTPSEDIDTDLTQI